MFEWDSAKAAANAAKHAVPFDEASTVFADADGLDGPDIRHSETEARRLRLGRSAAGRLLTVAYTLRRTARGEAIRIISARRASRKERSAYADPQTD
ncbi:MAG TPA: BrnT family toxin [Vicinamibacterales bacterium]|nr:BrnT family toxin [Vicinamibacterales bacterium]